MPGINGYDIVFQSWTVYSLDRLVSPLLTVALSLTVLSWSDFVRHGETRLVISEIMHQGSRGDDDRAAVLAFRLRAALFAVNALCIVVAAAVAIPILLEPSRAESDQSQFSW